MVDMLLQTKNNGSLNKVRTLNRITNRTAVLNIYDSDYYDGIKNARSEIRKFSGKIS